MYVPLDSLNPDFLALSFVIPLRPKARESAWNNGKRGEAWNGCPVRPA